MALEIEERCAEQIPHTLLVRLKAVYDTLKTAEKKAADLLITDPVFFSGATIVEAAEAAGCSEATLVRLSKKLGYKGYPELKMHIGKGDLGEAILYDDIKDGDSYDEVVKKVFHASIQALKDTLSIIDKQEYAAAVDAMLKARKFVFAGVGDSANVAHSGYQKFLRIGANVQCSADPDIQLIGVSQLKAGDVLVAISHSGETKSIVNLVKYAKETGAVVITITNYPRSALAKISDVVLLTAAFTEHVKGEIISKRVAQLCIIESLFVNVLIRQKSTFLTDLNRSNSALEINKL